MSEQATIEEHLRHAANELAKAEEYAEKRRWQLVMAALIASTAPLEHLYALRAHLTTEQRKDLKSMVARVETMWRQTLRAIETEEAELQKRARR